MTFRCYGFALSVNFAHLSCLCCLSRTVLIGADIIPMHKMTYSVNFIIFSTTVQRFCTIKMFFVGNWKLFVQEEYHSQSSRCQTCAGCDRKNCTKFTYGTSSQSCAVVSKVF